jgi:hypothetical protein
MDAGTTAAELLLQHKWPILSARVAKVLGNFRVVVPAQQVQPL